MKSPSLKSIRPETQRSGPDSGVPQMDRENMADLTRSDPRLVIAYLAYALEDVRTLSGLGVQFLQMAIAAINEDISLKEASRPARSAARH
jgi:hypothetical protein